MSAVCDHRKVCKDGVAVRVKNQQKNVYLILCLLEYNYTFIEVVVYDFPWSSDHHRN